jgi:ankyrin repeat protein
VTGSNDQAALVEAIRAGDLPSLARILEAQPGLASARIEGRRPGASRTPLHVATDWPGHFPNGVAVVRALIAAGADVNARTTGRADTETPLHWAASSDDVEVAEALIAAGADLEAAGGSIGTPLDNAVGYGCWQVARLLVERGARVDKLWHAAALGLMSEVERLSVNATPEEINAAFWQACHGGQPRSAAYLLARGADPSFVPSYSRQTAVEIAQGLETRRETLVTWLRDRATPG